MSKIKENINGKKILSDIKFYTDYSKYDVEKKRMQTWEERVDVIMDMHKKNPNISHAFSNPEFVKLFDRATKAYKSKLTLGSQRIFQFGESILKHNAKAYNCVVSYADRLRVFQEAFYMLLCGCGIGVSLINDYVSKLPLLKKRNKESKIYVIDDSIEGWSDALGVLLSSYINPDLATFPEYSGYVVYFDYSNIRPKGAYISGGFKAPGPEGLKQSLERIERLIENELNVANTSEIKFRSIIAYDVLMHASDAVISGGVRRSASIVLFDPDDDEMMNAKTGDWYVTNPQRARSNNSALLLRDSDTFESDLKNLIKKTEQFGEPGFVIVDTKEQVVNPCVEISFAPHTSDYRSGWNLCNLTEINGAACTDEQTFYEACVASAVLGTLQASYTDFTYLTEETKEICEQEALLGCSITGFMDNPELLFNPEILRKGAHIINDVNEEVASYLGINPAARTTCVKPSGNASVLLGTTSGIHPEYDKRYFRVMQMNKMSDTSKFLKQMYPELVVEGVWSATKSDLAVYIPVVASDKAILKKHVGAIQQLEYVKLVQENWVMPGTHPERCINDKINNNVSNTITVSDWNEVCDYLIENKKYFTGVSMLSEFGDRIYNQAPFTSVYTPQEILEKYGEPSFYVSGLITSGLELFDNNLWMAIDYIKDKSLSIEGTPDSVVRKKDWIKRAKRFASRYFSSLDCMTDCMKDVYLHHKWMKIHKCVGNINLESFLMNNIIPEYVDINTMGAVACSGGECEITRL